MERVNEVRLGRNWLRKGDPCRVKGKQGLWRFEGAVLRDDGSVQVHLVGPVFKPYNPQMRTFDVSLLVRVACTGVNRAKVSKELTRTEFSLPPKKRR